jgi:hypothetical protein
MEIRIFRTTQTRWAVQQGHRSCLGVRALGHCQFGLVARMSEARAYRRSQMHG